MELNVTNRSKALPNAERQDDFDFGFSFEGANFIFMNSKLCGIISQSFLFVSKESIMFPETRAYRGEQTDA